MINIFVAFWLGLMAGAMCVAISNANQESERKDYDMWKMKVEQGRIEEIKELKERITSLEQELRIKDKMIEIMVNDIAIAKRMKFDKVIDLVQDMAKIDLVQDMTKDELVGEVTK